MTSTHPRGTQAPRVRLIHRNLRWEGAIDGLVRPLQDWLCTTERALGARLHNRRAARFPASPTPVSLPEASLPLQSWSRKCVYSEYIDRLLAHLSMALIAPASANALFSPWSASLLGVQRLRASL
jgi:hypothetical protein